MLKEKATFYYGAQGKNCAEAILMAANDIYHFGLTDTDFVLFRGFGGGMGCGSTCGALTGSISVLSKLFGTREDFRDLCSTFVREFEKCLGSQECEILAAKYKTEENRCVATVAIACEVLTAFINKLNGVKEVCPDDCTLSADDIKRVKGLGFLHHKGTNRFNGRVITRNGRVTAEEMSVIAEAASLYGDGHMMFTTRMTVEVSGIDYDNIEAFRSHIGQAGLMTGGTGSKVRPIVSCKGTTCQYGLYDTYALSQEAHEKFYIGYNSVSLPHKFKIAFGGCPNNCVKPSLNDVGVIGAKVPLYDESICRGCNKCQIETACPIHAAQVLDGKLVIDNDKCNNCGRCIAKCPFHCADEGTNGWKVYIGGRWGKNVAEGKPLRKIFTDKQQVFDAIEKTILFFRSEGIAGERLADTINRVGFDQAEAMILGDELFIRKNEILGLHVTGGASC